MLQSNLDGQANTCSRISMKTPSVSDKCCTACVQKSTPGRHRFHVEKKKI